MKSIIFLIILLTTVAFTQTPNWTSVKETNINVGSALSSDIFTNRDGSHIIVQESNNLKYYKMNINGQAGTPVTLESTSVVSPSISGDATRLYAVYRKSNENYIRTKYSSDGGSNWSYISNLNYNASLMESVFSNNNLHVTYQVGSSVYYSRYVTGQGWTSPYTVSNTESGTSPRITARYDGSNDYVYFLYQKQNADEGKWRSYNVLQNSWGTLYTGFALSGVLFSTPSGLRVTGERIIIYYDYYKVVQGNAYWHFGFTEKSFSNNFLRGGYYFGNQSGKIYSTTTADNTSHTTFFHVNVSGPEEPLYQGAYDWEIDRSKSESGGINDLVYGYDDEPTYFKFNNLSAAGNEVHVIWQDNLGSNNGNNLRYKFDNQNSIAPQNLTMTSYNNHPKLVWQKNPEQDLD